MVALADKTIPLETEPSVSSSSNTTKTYFLWDGLNPILDQDETYANKNFNFHGATPVPGIGSIVFSANNESGASQQVPLHDHRGTTFSIVKPTDDSVTQTYEFSAYGEKDAETGSVENKYQYQSNWIKLKQGDGGQFGELYLPPIGQRFYHAGIGRFLGRDPLDVQLAIIGVGILGPSFRSNFGNRYGYVANNPVNEVDPFGLDIAKDAEIAALKRIIKEEKENLKRNPKSIRSKVIIARLKFRVVELEVEKKIEEAKKRAEEAIKAAEEAAERVRNPPPELPALPQPIPFPYPRPLPRGPELPGPAGVGRIIDCCFCAACIGLAGPCVALCGGPLNPGFILCFIPCVTLVIGPLAKDCIKTCFSCWGLPTEGL